MICTWPWREPNPRGFSQYTWVVIDLIKVMSAAMTAQFIALSLKWSPWKLSCDSVSSWINKDGPNLEMYYDVKNSVLFLSSAIGSHRYKSALLNNVYCCCNSARPAITYKVVQMWPGLIVCILVTVCPGHIWTTLYYLVTKQTQYQS
jgi:hypothetical protein